MSGIGTVTIPSGVAEMAAACGSPSLRCPGRPDLRPGPCALSSNRFQSSKVNVNAAVVVMTARTPVARVAARREPREEHAVRFRDPDERLTTL
jgi:hypothetical protein